MAHAIWSGAINFGLVTIPVKLQTAIRTNDLRFNFSTQDGRRSREQRAALFDRWPRSFRYNDIVRGYEYEKGPLRHPRRTKISRASIPEATQSVDIVQFVELTEIDPMYFDKPYYLEPEKRGRHAYALYCARRSRPRAKSASRRSSSARANIIAALKPSGEALVLELMHFADEIVDQSGTLELTGERKAGRKRDESRADAHRHDDARPSTPRTFRDNVSRSKLLAMIEARAAGKEAPEGRAPPHRDATTSSISWTCCRRVSNSRRARAARVKLRAAQQTRRTRSRRKRPSASGPRHKRGARR